MTERSESQRILRNILSGLSTWVFPLLLGLTVTRVVVRELGHNDYGIYALVLGFVSYSFNFSVGRAITKFLATYRASVETEKIRSIISATAFVTFVVALIGFVAIMLASGWLVRDVFDIEPDAQLKAIRAMQVSAAMIFVLMLTQIATAVLQGLHRFDIFSRIQISNNVLMMLGNLWLAYNGYGLVALLYWNLAAMVITCTMAFVSAKRLLPELSFNFDFNRDVIRMVLRYTSGVIGYQIAGNAFFIFERSWIISKLGAENLTFYVIPMTLGLYLHGFIGSLAMFLFPLASELDQDKDRLLRLYRLATKAVLFVTVIISASLIVEGRLFLTLWMGPEFGDRSSYLLTLLTIAFAMAAVSIVSFQTAEGLGNPGFNFRNTVLGALVATLVILLFTDQSGSSAVATGRMIFFAVPFIAIFDLERRRLGGIQTGFWLGNLVRFSAAAISAAAIEKIVIAGLSPGWISFCIATTAGCVAYLVVSWLSGVASDEDRRSITRLFRRA